MFGYMSLCPQMGHFLYTWNYFLCDFATLSAKSTNVFDVTNMHYQLLFAWLYVWFLSKGSVFGWSNGSMRRS